MDTRNEVREFLTSRRAKITPEQAGLRTYGGTRRVPGLRREEVALLAGVSVDYYTRLERGNLSGVSETVLEALARALQLDDAERAHLFDLARATQTTPRTRRRPAPQQVRPCVQRMLDAMTGGAGVRAERAPGHPRREPARPRALLGDVRRPAPAREHGAVRLPRPARAELLRRLGPVTNDAVAILRSEAGRNPYDRDLSDLVGELSTQSELFRTRWAAHNVRYHDTGLKRFHHPVVGELDADVRDDDARRRLGADDVRLHRRARLEVRGGAEPPRELDRNALKTVTEGA